MSGIEGEKSEEQKEKVGKQLEGHDAQDSRFEGRGAHFEFFYKIRKPQRSGEGRGARLYFCAVCLFWTV